MSPIAFHCHIPYLVWEQIQSKLLYFVMVCFCLVFELLRTVGIPFEFEQLKL